jgi:hypothetical protein
LALDGDGALLDAAGIDCVHAGVARKKTSDPKTV